MDMDQSSRNHGGMVRRPPKPPERPKRPPPPLYLGQWIRALGLRQRDVAKGVPMNEGYLSELIRGVAKKNPSPAMIYAIATFMGIPPHYLNEPPPDRAFIEKAATIDPSVLARLWPPKH